MQTSNSTEPRLLVEDDGRGLVGSPGGVLSWMTVYAPTGEDPLRVRTAGQASAPANVIVQAGITLTLAAGADLNIDFANRHLRVRAGARVIVKQGARIR